MSGVFEAKIGKTANPVLIPSKDTGKATMVKDTSTAQAITTLATTGEAAYKSYVKNDTLNRVKAIRDSYHDGQTLGVKPSEPSTLQQAADGTIDPLTAAPAPVQKHQIDRAKGELNAISVMRDQGGSASKALIDMQAVIKEAQATNPGYADEIQAYAVEKLGYDPGGLYMKTALARESQAIAQANTLETHMREAGFDNPSDPQQVAKYNEQLQQSHESAIAQAKATLAFTKAKTIKAQADAGKITREQATARTASVHKTATLKGLYGVSETISAESEVYQENLKAVLAADTDAQTKTDSIIQLRKAANDSLNRVQQSLSGIAAQAANFGDKSLSAEVKTVLTLQTQAVKDARGIISTMVDGSKVPTREELSKQVMQLELFRLSPAYYNIYQQSLFDPGGLAVPETLNTAHTAAIKLYNVELARWKKEQASSGHPVTDEEAKKELEKVSIASVKQGISHPLSAGMVSTKVGLLNSTPGAYNALTEYEAENIFKNFTVNMSEMNTKTWTSAPFQNMLRAVDNPEFMNHYGEWLKGSEYEQTFRDFQSHSAQIASETILRAVNPIAVASKASMLASGSRMVVHPDGSVMGDIRSMPYTSRTNRTSLSAIRKATDSVSQAINSSSIIQRVAGDAVNNGKVLETLATSPVAYFTYKEGKNLPLRGSVLDKKWNSHFKLKQDAFIIDGDMYTVEGDEFVYQREATTLKDVRDVLGQVVDIPADATEYEAYGIKWKKDGNNWVAK